jgi:alanine-synthesizing transaminase
MVFSGGNELDEVKGAVMQLAAMRLCGNAVTQLAIPAALADPDSTKAMLVPGGRLYEQRKATIDLLETIEGVSLVPNRAAFYLFPSIDPKLYDFESDQDFAMQFLHEKHILVIPGRGFDWHEDIRFRIVMLPEPQELHRAMEELANFLSKHRR